MIRIKKLHPNAKIPQRANATDAVSTTVKIDAIRNLIFIQLILRYNK
jgi:hypothetical protein